MTSGMNQTLETARLYGKTNNMWWAWIEWNFDLHEIGVRWNQCNDITCQWVTLAQGGPF